jgi:hypothetical protein
MKKTEGQKSHATVPLTPNLLSQVLLYSYRYHIITIGKIRTCTELRLRIMLHSVESPYIRYTA